jgi:hypothetical protein
MMTAGHDNDRPAPAPTLKEICLGLLAALVFSAESPQPQSAEEEYLRRFYRAAPGGELVSADFAGSDPADQRLLRAAAELGLSRVEILAIKFAVLVEENVMAGRAVAWLQAAFKGCLL